MVAGDGLDNDCDGKTDEEKLDKIDNDGDGKIDEDLQVVNHFISSSVKFRKTKTLHVSQVQLAIENHPPLALNRASKPICLRRIDRFAGIKGFDTSKNQNPTNDF